MQWGRWCGLGGERGSGLMGRKRKSKDRKVNREEKTLVEFLEEREWGIMNGSSVKYDKEGQYTFTRRGGIR